MDQQSKKRRISGGGKKQLFEEWKKRKEYKQYCLENGDDENSSYSEEWAEPSQEFKDKKKVVHKINKNIYKSNNFKYLVTLDPEKEPRDFLYSDANDSST